MSELFNPNQFSSAKGIAEFQAKLQRSEDQLRAQKKAEADAQRTRELLGAERYAYGEKIRIEREQIELTRYKDNRRLSLIALWIAVISAVIAVIK